MNTSSQASPTESPTAPVSRGRRWCRRVPVAILALGALALGWIWGFQDELRQNQFLGSVIISGSAAILP